MFFRQNVVGKFGVPKYGDEEEYPFEPREINMLKSKFGKLKVYYPEFKFFIMLGTYIFKNKKAEKFFKSVDEFFYKYIKIFNKYSYNQIIEFKKTN